MYCSLEKNVDDSEGRTIPEDETMGPEGRVIVLEGETKSHRGLFPVFET